MGHYTKFECKIKLRVDTPPEVISLLVKFLKYNYQGIEREFWDSEEHEGVHDFFETERWDVLLTGEIFKKKYNWVIEIETELKNYCGEIQLFLEWIAPYISNKRKRRFIGWMQDEEMNSPIITIFVTKSKDTNKVGYQWPSRLFN